MASLAALAAAPGSVRAAPTAVAAVAIAVRWD